VGADVLPRGRLADATGLAQAAANEPDVLRTSRDHAANVAARAIRHYGLVAARSVRPPSRRPAWRTRQQTARLRPFHRAPFSSPQLLGIQAYSQIGARRRSHTQCRNRNSPLLS